MSALGERWLRHPRIRRSGVVLGEPPKHDNVRWLARCAIVLAVFASACASTDDGDRAAERVVRALGTWELAKGGFPDDSIHAPLIEAADAFFGATLSSVRKWEGDGLLYCGEHHEEVMALLTISVVDDDGVSPVQVVQLRNEWIDTSDPIATADLTGDGVDEIVVRTWCYDTSGVILFSHVGGMWIRLDAGAATDFENGVLFSLDKDCLPSCADSGVEYSGFKWNGASFDRSGPVTKQGEPVSLQVEMSCATYTRVSTLPIPQCSEGPLVRKFLILAQNVIGDYDEGVSVTHVVNKFDERVAAWVLTYRYRHDLPLTKVIDDDLFNALGIHWNPGSDAERAVFDSFCAGGNPMMCEYGEREIRYLFPSEECPQYRASGAEWPVQRCDYGGWVGVLAVALEEFDGQGFELTNEAVLFDGRLESRVREFQRASGLEVDGYVGRNTWRALQDMPGSPLRGGWDTNGDGIFGPGDVIPH